jgi:hypothetical protein
MLCVPAARLAVLQAAVPVLPEPVRATVAQPLSVAPSAVKLTLPVGALPVTAAVRVTLAPTRDGLPELASVVVLATLLTICDNETLADPAFDASPLYVAVILCVPTARAVVAHCTVRMFPEPDSATALHPPIDVAPSWKFNVPVGALPLTVAVNKTLAPKVEGVDEVATAVVVATLLTVCDSVALEPLLALSPL